jgi:hypothetical protein
MFSRDAHYFLGMAELSAYMIRPGDLVAVMSGIAWIDEILHSGALNAL